MAAKTKKDKEKQARKRRSRSQPGPDPLDVTHQEPVVQAPEVDVESVEPEIEAKSPLIESVKVPGKVLSRQARRLNEKLFWPKDQEMPTHYSKPKPLPCPKCKRVRLDNLGQCCVVMRAGRHVVYMRCKNCSHRWSLPVR